MGCRRIHKMLNHLQKPELCRITAHQLVPLSPVLHEGLLWRRVGTRDGDLYTYNNFFALVNLGC